MSAGKNLSAGTTHGNRWLLGALGDAAAARTKNAYLNSYYKRTVKRRGPRRALVAVMHTILTAVDALAFPVEWADTIHAGRGRADGDS